MFSLKTAAIACLALAGFSNAACAYTYGHGFDMKIYSGTGCTGTHEEFYGTHLTGYSCACFEVAASLNDKVKAFAFTSAGELKLYADAGCKGTLLGSSAGSWLHDNSAAGQTMSSFQVCY